MDDDDLRINALRSVVDTWKPRDQRGRDSKKRFADQLKKAIEELGDSDKDVEITGSAVVVGPQGTLLHAQDLRPLWTSAVSDGEEPWNAAQREAQEKTGVPAAHPEDGPQLVDAAIHTTEDGSTRLDLRFLLFADHAPNDSSKWFNDDEAKAVADASYRHALEVAHSIRDEAKR